MADSIDHTDPDAQLREVLEGLRDDPDEANTLLLRERHGLTMRRTCGGLEDGFGLDLSPGGLAQMIQRCASRLEGEEARLLKAARSSEVQHVDETSW